MTVSGVVELRRCIGDELMDAASWAGFVQDTCALIERAHGVVRAMAWRVNRRDVLVYEDLAFLIFEVADVHELMAGLSWLALVYSQESITLMIGKRFEIRPAVHALFGEASEDGSA